MEDGYKVGDIIDQTVDPDRLAYWCLLEHAKNKLGKKGNIKLFFRDPEKGKVRFHESLQLVHNDATTCQLLSVLNDKKRLMFILFVLVVKMVLVGLVAIERPKKKDLFCVMIMS